jgi:hypothetical protein
VAVPPGEEDRDPQLCKPYASDIYSMLAERSSYSLRCGQPMSFRLLPSPYRSGGPPSTTPCPMAAPHHGGARGSNLVMRHSSTHHHRPCHTARRARATPWRECALRQATIGAQISISRCPTTLAPSLVPRCQPRCILSTSPSPTILFPRPGEGLPYFPPFSCSGKPSHGCRKALSAASSFR